MPAPEVPALAAAIAALFAKLDEWAAVAVKAAEAAAPGSGAVVAKALQTEEDAVKAAVDVVQASAEVTAEVLAAVKSGRAPVNPDPTDAG